jgi:hypothetical protein
MLEDCTALEIALRLIQANDLDLILGILNEGAQRKPEVGFWLVTKADRIEREL